MLAGPNVIESEEHVLHMAKHIRGITAKYVFRLELGFVKAIALGGNGNTEEDARSLFCSLLLSSFDLTGLHLLS